MCTSSSFLPFRNNMLLDAPLLHPSAFDRSTLRVPLFKSKMQLVFFPSPHLKSSSILSACVFSKSILNCISKEMPSPAFSSCPADPISSLSSAYPSVRRFFNSSTGTNCSVWSGIIFTSRTRLKKPHQPSRYVGPQSFQNGMHSHSLAHAAISLLPSGVSKDCGA